MRSALLLCWLISAGLASKAQTEPQTNYETMKKYLSIRIYPKEPVDAHGGTDSLIFRTDLEGTYTLLMLDFPGAFTPVRRAMFEEWKKPEPEVFAAAQANIDSIKVARSTKTFDLKDVKLDVTMLGEENYAASYALDLEKNAPDLVGEWGSVVAMPYKGLVSLCKLSRENLPDLGAFIQLTHAFIEKSYQEQPQPISDQYFWYYHGKFSPIDTRFDENGTFHVVAPPGLSELMTQKP